MDMVAVIGMYQHKSTYEGEGREAECIYKTSNAVSSKEGLSSRSQAVGGALRGPFASTSRLVLQVLSEGGKILRKRATPGRMMALSGMEKVI